MQIVPPPHCRVFSLQTSSGKNWDLVQTQGSLAITPGGRRSADIRKHLGNETYFDGSWELLPTAWCAGTFRLEDFLKAFSEIWEIGPSRVLHRGLESSALPLLSVPSMLGLLSCPPWWDSCMFYSSLVQLGVYIHFCACLLLFTLSILAVLRCFNSLLIGH